MPVSLDAETISRTIGAIYDCALGTENWPNALHKLAEVMDSSYGMLLRANPSLGVVQSIGQWGLDRSAFDAMDLDWRHKLPVIWHMADAPVAEPFNMVQAAEAMSIPDIWDQPFFSEFARPAGYGDAAAVVLYRTEYRILTLAMVSHVHEPVISRERLDQLRMFVPHLQRAIRLGASIDRQSLTLNAYERLLDALGLPVILLGQNGKVRHANLAANDLLKSSDGLSLRDELLRIVGDDVATQNLQDLVRSVGSGDRGSGVESLSFMSKSGDPGIAYVIALGPEVARRNHGGGVHTAVLLCSPIRARAPIEALSSLFGLTEAESRVMECIATGLNRQEAAESLGVADSTVKSHLDHIFAKTGMNSQAALLESLARLSVPLRGQ